MSNEQVTRLSCTLQDCYLQKQQHCYYNVLNKVAFHKLFCSEYFTFIFTMKKITVLECFSILSLFHQPLELDCAWMPFLTWFSTAEFSSFFTDFIVFGKKLSFTFHKSFIFNLAFYFSWNV